MGESVAIPGLSGELVRVLSRRGVSLHFRKGQRLLTEGAPFSHVPLVQSGSVRLTKRDAAGRELVIGWLGPGHLVGLPGLFMSAPFLSAEAVEPVRAYGLKGDIILDRLRRDHGFSLWVMRYLASLLRDSRSAVFSSAVKFGRERVAEEVLRLAPAGARRASPAAFRLNRGELADRTGLAKETISRLLAGLVREGAIALEGANVRIVSRGRLTAIAGIEGPA